jgi:putative ATP-grasp target RiPP
MTTNTAVRPWGLSRASDITPVEVDSVSVEIDPRTQTGTTGGGNDGKALEPMEAGKHGSATSTYPRTGTSRDGSGSPAPDSDTGHDGDRD